jgi:hypothetical protein
MWKRDPRPIKVICEGKCKFISEAKGNEFDCPQEPLPDATMEPSVGKAC